MAPEAAMAGGQPAAGYTSSVDLFSFGVMFAVLLLQVQWPGKPQPLVAAATAAEAAAASREGVIAHAGA
jgi:hypothetical protein